MNISEPFAALRRIQSKKLQQSDDEAVRQAMAQSWIIYHLAGALAQRAVERGNKPTYAASVLARVSADIHHYVLQSCRSCFDHHAAYLRLHPIDGQVRDFEKYVFDMHNHVNVVADKPQLTPVDFTAVREHYRGTLGRMGKQTTATVLSKSLPAIYGRYCYDC